MQADESLDTLFQGRIRILQKKGGYRFSLDALLVAAFALPSVGDVILDLGTGSGVIALILAVTRPTARITGVEIQPELAGMAKRTVEMNGLSSRIQIITGDVRDHGELLPRHCFDSCVMNPPYRRLRSGRINPMGEKAAARHELHGTVAAFLATAHHALAPHGRLFTIYPASRLGTLVEEMRAARLEPKRCRFVHSHAGGRGEFALVEGRKGGREELFIEPPLIVYGEGRQYTDEMARILTGLASAPGAAGKSPFPSRDE